MAKIALTARVASMGAATQPATEGESKMDDVQAAKAPIHLWIVGLLARFRNRVYFRSMAPDVDPNAMLAWVDGFPIYAQFGWGLGVWMGLLGSLLLLMRHRWAVPAFALSLLGAVVGLGYQIFMAPPPPPPMDSGAMAAMPWVIIAVAALFLFYAQRQKQSGVLR